MSQDFLLGMDKLKPNTDIIEDLRNKLTITSQERDAAMEMSKLSEVLLSNMREEMKILLSQSKAEALKKEKESMQADYSEAIKLLEAKVKSLEKDLKLARSKNINGDEEIEGLKSKLRFVEEDKKDLEIRYKNNKDEKEQIEKELRLMQRKLEEAGKVATEAQEKVKEALVMAHDALANEACISEEKKQLEKKLGNVVIELEDRLDKEIESVKSNMNSRIEVLANQLQAAISEKNKLSLECESIKAEYELRSKESSLKYQSLSNELSDVRSRRMHEVSQWSEEKELLRKHILSLQADLEKAFLELREKKEAQCENCSQLKEHIDKYRILAKEWEEAAFSVAKEFEKYNAEVQKFKAGHKSKE